MKRLSVYLFALLVAIGGVACSERSDNQMEQDTRDPMEEPMEEMQRDTTDTTGQDTLGF